MKRTHMVQAKHGITVLLVALFVCLLAGCSAGNGDSRMGVDGYVYVAEAMQNIGWDTAENFYVAGEYLYYLSDSRTVKRIPLEDDKMPDLSKGETVLTLSSLSSGGASTYLTSDSIADYAVDQEGNIYCVVADYAGVRSDSGLTMECVGGTLHKLTPAGEPAYRLKLPEADGVSYGSGCLALDGRGKAYVLSGVGIFEVDEGGRIAESLAVEPVDSFGRVRLLEGSGGQVFYYVAEFGTRIRRDTFLINGAESLRLDAVPVLSERSGVELYSGLGGLLKSYGGRLYRYDGESLTEILKWGDSDIFEDDIEEVIQIDANRYIVSVRAADTGSSQTVFLTKTAMAELPRKETILLASLFPSDALKQSVVDFNRSSDKYHVTIESYGADFYGGDANEEAYLRLDSSLVSKNTPDILDLADLEVSKYAESGMLEDLYPYLEGESIVNKENYPGNLLDGYTVDGKLICIPTGFWFLAWVGETPEARICEDWTLPEIMKLTEKYPDMKLFGAYYLDSSEYLLEEFCAPYYLEQFVDWEGGRCSFNSEEFRSLLEWVKVQEGKREWPTDGSLQLGLLGRQDMHDFKSYYEIITLYGEDVAVHGYPSVDGTGKYVPEVEGALGILAGSHYKEGAWEFLQYYLSQEDYGWNFPTRLDLLGEKYQEATSSERGHTYFDANGVPIDGYGKLEQEQADTLMRMLEAVDFTPRSGAEDSIVRIVSEEAQYFFGGGKTVEEVCDVIQNKAELLLQERGIQ